MIKINKNELKDIISYEKIFKVFDKTTIFGNLLPFYFICELLKVSKCEKLVLSLLLKGLSNKEIGDQICVSEKTVKFHCTAIYRKFRDRVFFYKDYNGRKKVIIYYYMIDKLISSNTNFVARNYVDKQKMSSIVQIPDEIINLIIKDIVKHLNNQALIDIDSGI